VQGLIEELHIHQEEIRVQNEQLTETHHALEASRDRYAELYDFAPVPLVGLDEYGVVLEVNVAALRLLGVDRGRIVRMPLVLQLEPSSRRPFLEFLSAMRRGESAEPFELELATRNGPVPIELTGKRSESESASTPTIYLVWHDLRERRRAEQQQLQAAFEREHLRHEEAAARAASEAKDRFLAILSHELRTPLTPVLLTLETLDRKPDDAELQRQSLDVIRRNLLIETRLIDDLLDLTRIEVNKLHLQTERVNLHDAIQHAVAMCRSEAQARDLTLRLQLDAKNPFVDGDETRLQQIFWNLIRNAVRYTPNGGEVRVVSRDHPETGFIGVEVSDTGRGIPAADLERVFQPFQQVKGSVEHGGLGLGLAICRGLVEGHGGTIRAGSEGPGRGATFTVELPRSARRASPHVDAARRRKRQMGQRFRVLLVEDNCDTAEALGTLLQLEGYEVDVAHSLDEARRRAQAGYDLLLSDLQLPDGSGLDLMRELGGYVRGIAMSGYGAQGDVRRSREAGFEAHLVKPVEFAKVLEAIEAVAPRD
jgi:PAS domain S-box-containing protein